MGTEDASCQSQRLLGKEGERLCILGLGSHESRLLGVYEEHTGDLSQFSQKRRECQEAPGHTCNTILNIRVLLLL